MRLTGTDALATASEVARAMGVTLYNVRAEGNRSPDDVELVLRPDGLTPERYRKRSASTGRRVWACNADAHWDFMELVLTENPDMRIRSTLADFHGLRDFYAKAPAVDALARRSEAAA